MPKTAQLPDVSLLEGQCWRYSRPLAGTGRSRVVDHYTVIGRVGQDPFLLEYQEGGLTYWNSPANLGDRVRRKVLSVLRKQARHAQALPAWCGFHDWSALDQNVSHHRLSEASSDFFERRWKDATLNDRTEDYVDLNVPFAEKDEARALGALWDPARRVWRANLARLEAKRFERWLTP